MTLPTIEVPARLAGAFVSDALLDVDLQTLGADNYGPRLVDNGARFTQVAAARMWQALPQLVPTQAQGLLDVAWTTTAAIQTYKNASFGETLGAISDAGLLVLDTMFEAMSIVESVPLIGMIAKVGTTVQKIFWSQWMASVKIPPAEQGLAYDQASDQWWSNQVLGWIDAGDLTGIFAPFIARPTGWEQRTVQDLLKGGNNRWTFAAPQGEETGVGNVPGTTTFSQAYQSGWGFGQYRPTLQQAATTAWQMVLAPDRTRYLVDAVQLRDQWDAYWLNVAMGSIYVPSRKDGMTGVLHRAQRPLVPYPAGLYGDEATAYRLARQAAGYQHWGSYFDEYPFLKIEQRGYTPNMAGLTRHNIERQLQARQSDGLRTLLVAYVSRDDPAFRHDPQLRAQLETNRGLLLKHAARWQVDLERVPDDDYRSALRQATPGQPPVGGLVFGGGGKTDRPTGPGGLMVPPRKTHAKLFPGPAVKVASPIQMIGGDVGPAGASVDPKAGAAALALLGFLLK